MGKSFEKRLIEEGHSAQEVLDYEQLYGAGATMSKFKVGFLALTRLHDANVRSPYLHRLPVAANEISGKAFEHFLQSILDHFSNMEAQIEELKAINAKQNQEIEYLRSMSDKACFSKMVEVMKVCGEGDG